VHVIALETREKRASRKADVAMMARVGDATPLTYDDLPLLDNQNCSVEIRVFILNILVNTCSERISYRNCWGRCDCGDNCGVEFCFGDVGALQANKPWTNISKQKSKITLCVFLISVSFPR
jgi:hypothetical protein